VQFVPIKEFYESFRFHHSSFFHFAINNLICVFAPNLFVDIGPSLSIITSNIEKEKDIVQEEIESATIPDLEKPPCQESRLKIQLNQFHTSTCN
jgi:hypothetical protein